MGLGNEFFAEGRHEGETGVVRLQIAYDYAIENAFLRFVVSTLIARRIGRSRSSGFQILYEGKSSEIGTTVHRMHMLKNKNKIKCFGMCPSADTSPNYRAPVASERRIFNAFKNGKCTDADFYISARCIFVRD